MFFWHTTTTLSPLPDMLAFRDLKNTPQIPFNQFPFIYLLSEDQQKVWKGKEWSFLFELPLCVGNNFPN